MSVSRGFLGTGFAFPPQIDKATGRFKMVSAEEDIKQSIYIILMTKKNEYPMLPRFGSNIHNYVFELPEESYLMLLRNEIVEALTVWEPRVINVKVDFDLTEIANGKLIFNVGYTVRATNNPNNLVFPYYLYEGVGS